MRVLGISHLEPFSAYFHGTSACLVEDGMVVAAAAEERFTRVPQYAGYPACTLNWLLTRDGLGWDDIDAVAVPWPPQGNELGLSRSPRSSRWHDAQVIFVDHQTAHAHSAAAYATADHGFVLTLDGMGFDGASTSGGAAFCLGPGAAMERLRIFERIGSTLGEFYGAITLALGWRMLRDEGKTMALAAFASSSQKVTREVAALAPRFEGGQIVGPQLELSEPPLRNGVHRIELTGATKRQMAELVRRHGREAVARAAQDILEARVLEVAEAVCSPRSYLCLAGGVFLNIHVNRRLREAGYPVFPYPNPGDGGTAVGAALAAYGRLTKRPIRQERSPIYLGPEFSELEIEGVLRRSGIDYWRPEDRARELATLLLRGQVVGLFDGPAEWGPRALGNRSVLADPSTPGVKDRLNMILKKRDHFQPFGALMSERAAQEHLEGASPSPFMIDAFRVRESSRALFPAVVHADHTVRPQILRKGDHELCDHVLASFGEVRGFEVLLNTSLNLHGESMCHSPADAVSLLRRRSLDSLCIGPFIALRPEVTGTRTLVCPR